MRLFVSLRPPGEVVANLRARLPQWPGPADRWHVTLAFLGDDADPGPVHAALGEALQGVVLAERAYRPHLTVGRRGRPDPSLLADYRGPAWTAREVELVRSDLGREVVHTVLERYPLDGPAGGQPCSAPSGSDSTISS